MRAHRVAVVPADHNAGHGSRAPTRPTCRAIRALKPGSLSFASLSGQRFVIVILVKGGLSWSSCLLATWRQPPHAAPGLRPRSSFSSAEPMPNTTLLATRGFASWGRGQGVQRGACGKMWRRGRATQPGNEWHSGVKRGRLAECRSPDGTALVAAGIQDTGNPLLVVAQVAALPRQCRWSTARPRTRPPVSGHGRSAPASSRGRT